MILTGGENSKDHQSPVPCLVTVRSPC